MPDLDAPPYYRASDWSPEPTPPVPPGPPTPPSPPSERPTGRFRSPIVAAIAGGLCGALVATGVSVLLDDDPAPAPATAVETPTVNRSSTELTADADIASIIAKVEPTVVTISAGNSAGTGFVVREDGYIVTNAHVVGDAGSVEVTFSDGQTADADVVGADSNFDLAVVKVDRTGLAVVELGDSDAVQVGDAVVAIGNALGLEGGVSVTTGIISGPPREVIDEANGIRLEGALQTDAAINPGNSGGPLVDTQGRVVGINTAVANPQYAQNVGFAIAISNVGPVIEDLIAGRTPAFLGVGTETVTPDVADEVGTDSGARVIDVTAGSGADEAGIEADDVIVEISGVEIADSSDVPAAVRQHRPGDEIEVVVVRDGERQTLTATLTERPESG